MPGLAAGLLNGMAAYQRGRQIGDEQRQRQAQIAFEQDRQVRAEERAARLDAQQQTMLQAQLEQMRKAAEYRAQDQQRQAAADGRSDFEGGYRAAPQVQQMGAAVGQMGAASTGPNASVLSGVARFLGDAAARPAFDRGGVGMVKAGESMREQERRAELQARQAESAAEADRRARERADDRTFTASENQKNRNATMAGISARLGSAQGQTPRAVLPTEGERKAAALYTVAESGYNTLESLLQQKDPQGNPKVDPKTGQPVQREAPGWVDLQKQRIGFGVGNTLTSEQQQRATQAANQLADMWMRYTSGAAVPETEVQRFAQTFTPLPGDGMETLQQKQAARSKIISALRQAAGRALVVPPEEGTAPSMAPASAPPLDSFWGRP